VGKKNSKHSSWKGFGRISGHLWSKIKKNAEKRHIPVKITIKQAWEKFQRQNGKCSLTGLKLIFGRTALTTWAKTASLDRKDSNSDYNINNIRWLHYKINMMKGKMSDKEFIYWCCKVVEFYDGKKKKEIMT